MEDQSKQSRAILQAIGKVFCKDENDFVEVPQAIQEFENLVSGLIDVEFTDETNRANIHFDNGKALGTTWAAMCIRDILRTKLFIKSIFRAIEDVKKVKNGPIHILYAGTGPYATLALPIMASYSPLDLQFTFLEINEISFDSARKVISEFGFDEFVVEMVQADATKYIVDPNNHIDILVSETMQAALAREQQVAIYYNLVPQLNPDVILIPENITLSLAMMNFSSLENMDNVETKIFRLGKIFELSQGEIRKDNQARENENVGFYFPQHSIKIPTEKVREFCSLVVLTEIQVYKNDRLSINQSGLTVPIILDNLTPGSSATSVQIGYKVDEVPGITYLPQYLDI